MWRRGYTQQAQGDTPVFEQWAGLRWEGHSCGPEEEVWGPPSKEQKREDGGGGGRGGGEHGLGQCQVPGLEEEHCGMSWAGGRGQ